MSRTQTVIVVDDDEVVRDSLKVLLELRRYDVRDFGSAAAFLAARDGTATTPGCLVLDIHMPKMSGLELLRELRSKGDGVPVILMTGRREPAAQSQAQALGAVALLDKPISHPALFAALEQALSQP